MVESEQWIPPCGFLSDKHEHVFKSLCESVRCALLNAPDAFVRITNGKIPIKCDAMREVK